MSIQTIEADVEAYAARIDGGLEKDLQTLEKYVNVEVQIILPYIKAAVALLLSQEGQAALQAAVAATPIAVGEAATGNVPGAIVTAGTAVIAALTTTVQANAIADAKTEIAAAKAGDSPVTN